MANNCPDMAVVADNVGCSLAVVEDIGLDDRVVDSMDNISNRLSMCHTVGAIEVANAEDMAGLADIVDTRQQLATDRTET